MARAARLSLPGGEPPDDVRRDRLCPLAGRDLDRVRRGGGEQLRYLFGIEIPNFKYEKLRDLARHLERVSGIPVQPTEPGIGLNVFSHESGIHTAGMLIHPAIYQFIPPADMGAKVEYIYGKHSGAVVVEHALRGAGITPEPKLVAGVLEEVKRIREERAERADFSEFHRNYYEHLGHLGLTAAEVVDIARAISADSKTKG